MSTPAHLRAWLAALCGLTVLGAVSAAPAAPPRDASDAASCGCKTPYRVYTDTPTPEVLALFKAAEEGDETAFMALLPSVGDVSRYAVKDRPLLPAIILPPQSFWNTLRERDTDDDLDTREHRMARAIESHRAQWPVRERMLEAALKAGASPTDMSYLSDDPALNEAIVFGSPRMVELLLAHGARPDVAGWRDNRTALGTLMALNDVLRGRLNREVNTRSERARMARALIAQRAPLPEDWSWPDAVALIEGDTLIRHLLDQGHRPSPEGLVYGANVLSAAAYHGDRQALAALQPLLPRTVPAEDTAAPPVDLWLDAAQAALAGGHPALATELLRADMPWSQTGPLSDGRYGGFGHDGQHQRRTVLEWAAHTGQGDLLPQLRQWGAALDGGLQAAINAGRPAIAARLVELGADPLAPWAPHGGSVTPLSKALEAAPDVALAMLTATQRRLAVPLTSHAERLLQAVLDSPASAPGAGKPERIRALQAAGLDLRQMGHEALRTALWREPEAVAMALLDGGAPATPAPAPDGRAAPEPSPPSLLVPVLRRAQASLLERLREAGAPWPPNALAHALHAGRLDWIEQVARQSGQPFSALCPASYAELIPLLRDAALAPALIARGMATGPCGTLPSLDQRLVASWLEEDAKPLMGSRRARASELLRRVGAAPAGSTATAAAAWMDLLHRAIDQGRSDVVDVVLAHHRPDDTALAGLALAALDAQDAALVARLRAAGLRDDAIVAPGQTLAHQARCEQPAGFAAAAGLPTAGPPCQPPAAKPTPADIKRARTLVGTYYLSNVREVGSGLQLAADGRFQYVLSYGAHDEAAQGRWQLRGQSVEFSTDPRPYVASPVTLQAATHDAGLTGIAIQLSYNGRAIEGVPLMVTGSAQSFTTRTRGRGDGGWVDLPDIGMPEGIALGGMGPDQNRWIIVPLPAPGAGPAPNRFTLAIDPQSVPTGRFDATFTLQGRDLVQTREGRRMVYVRSR